MTSRKDLGTRVSSNTNDFNALSEQLDRIAEVQQEHGADLGSVLQTLESRETSLSLQSGALSSMRHSMKRLEDGQRKQNKRLDSHGEKLDEILGLLRQRR